MGTALFLHQHHHQHQYRRTHVLLPCNNAPQPMRYLTLKRITTVAGNPLRFNRSKIFGAFSNSNRRDLEIAMADKAEKKDHSQSISGESAVLNGRKESEKELDKSTPKNIPPPPEKPEPGDCCGSGCVRCVWDVYYDELEEYNKALQK